jgi:hypothetical protein
VRTTVTLDPDTELVIRERMEFDRVSFKKALNDAIRDGARSRRRGAFKTHTYDLGEPSVDLTHALRRSAEAEDEAITSRLNADG